MTGLLKAASQNVKNGRASVRLFEVGSVFNSKREESLKISMLFSGDNSSENLTNFGKPKKVDFAFFVQKITNIIGSFELVTFEASHSLSHKYQCASVVIDGEVVGELFRVHPKPVAQ